MSVEIPAPLDVVISVINDNNRDGLRRCLRTVERAARGTTWSVHVIDNCSNDGTAAMIRREFPEVVLTVNRRRQGFGTNHNQVLRRIGRTREARHVLVLNDDTELDEGAVRRMVEHLDGDPRVGAVVPAVRDGGGHWAAMRLAWPTARSSWRFDWRTQSEGPDERGGWLQGCCVLLRSAAVAEVGGYDERYFLFYEDTDLSRRLRDAGWRLEECAEAGILHLGHATVLRPELSAFTPRQGLRSRYLYFRKWHGRWRSEGIAAVGRLLLGLRAARTLGSAIRHVDPAGVARARLFLNLMWYDPHADPPLPPRPLPNRSTTLP